mmetsp:Transcript_13989/g.28647  ORF Transcript_13989/g.28647 Transcript_13989/m.28647 type:complete len:220 (-) Transcript_13989:1049-1708(-)
MSSRPSPPRLLIQEVLTAFGPMNTFCSSIDALWLREMWAPEIKRQKSLLSRERAHVQHSTHRSFRFTPPLHPLVAVKKSNMQHSIRECWFSGRDNHTIHESAPARHAGHQVNEVLSHLMNPVGNDRVSLAYLQQQSQKNPLARQFLLSPGVVPPPCFLAIWRSPSFRLLPLSHQLFLPNSSSCSTYSRGRGIQGPTRRDVRSVPSDSTGVADRNDENSI